MSNYYLQAIVLEGCPYSNAAIELLNNHKNIKSKIITVNQSNKEDYKTIDISTFPQIYLKRNDKNGSLLLGGYDKLKEAFDTFYFNKYSKENVNNFINNKWSKKSVLRLIELINTK
jgi:glutaredoxin-related protein